MTSAPANAWAARRSRKGMPQATRPTASNGKNLGPLERRLRNCVVGVRAEPFAPGAEEWLALEVQLMRRAAGMAHEGVAVRP